eukprot:2531621-Rhodomonas_salina.3
MLPVQSPGAHLRPRRNLDFAEGDPEGGYPGALTALVSLHFVSYLSRHGTNYVPAQSVQSLHP